MIIVVVMIVILT